MITKKDTAKIRRDIELQVQSVLSIELLNKQWRERMKDSDHPTAGHCYIAAEAAYHLYGKEHGYRAKVLSGDDWTHWFLEHPDGRKIDPTREQFAPEPIEYHKARLCGFLTIKPSKRCQILLNRIALKTSKTA